MKLVPMVAALLAAAAPLAAFAAGSANGNIQVSSTVNANCTLQTNDLNFGYYDPIVANLTAALNRSTPIVVACTKGSHPIVVVGTFWVPNGPPPGPSIRSDVPGGLGASNLSNGGAGAQLATLRYTYRLDTPTITTGISAPTTWTLSGSVAGGQDQPVGSYSDILSVGVNF